MCPHCLLTKKPGANNTVYGHSYNALTGDLAIGGMVGVARLTMSSSPWAESPIRINANPPWLFGVRVRIPVRDSRYTHRSPNLSLGSPE